MREVLQLSEEQQAAVWREVAAAAAVVRVGGVQRPWVCNCIGFCKGRGAWRWDSLDGSKCSMAPSAGRTAKQARPATKPRACLPTALLSRRPAGSVATPPSHPAPAQDLYRPFKLNIAAIGNIVSQVLPSAQCGGPSLTHTRQRAHALCCACASAVLCIAPAWSIACAAQLASGPFACLMSPLPPPSPSLVCSCTSTSRGDWRWVCGLVACGGWSGWGSHARAAGGWWYCASTGRQL